MSHCHKNGGRPPLLDNRTEKFQSCQLIQEKVKIVDAGRVVNNYVAAASSPIRMKYAEKMSFYSPETSDCDDGQLLLPQHQSSDDNSLELHYHVQSPSNSTATSSPSLGRHLSPPAATQIPNHQYDGLSILPPWTTSILPVRTKDALAIDDVVVPLSRVTAP